MSSEGCRYAPSTTGLAHPGTLLSGLLCYLDARGRGAPITLRLEDLDPARCRPELAERMVEDLSWLGLEFDAVIRQSELAHQHAAALDALEAAGVLYPCGCPRSRLRDLGRRGPDGGFAYDNHCRDRRFGAGGWRRAGEAVRARLPDRRVELIGEEGLDLSGRPASDMGDPVVVRRDGAVAYNVAVVVDDAASGVTRVVRGRDLASSSATQVLLHELLELPVPTYRHHLLLLEPAGDKLAKLHGSVDAGTLRARYDGAELCGLLAWIAGLRPSPAAVAPAELVADFAWSRVTTTDVVMAWDGRELARVG